MPVNSFRGPVAEETSNLCYLVEIAKDGEPVKKALMASPPAMSTSQDSVNSNLVTFSVDSGASGHYFDDAIIREVRHRLQDYGHLDMPRRTLTAGGS